MVYSLHFVFFHILCNFSNFQLLAEMLNFKFIETALSDRMARVPGQTALGAQPSLGTYPPYEATGDHGSKKVKRRCLKSRE